MAKKIQAIQAYRPRIDLGDSTKTERFLELITQRTTLSPGVVKNVQESEVETLIGLLLDGHAVHTGTALYTPNIDVEGKFSVTVRVDKRILRALNGDGAFRGKLINAENIGMTSDQMVAVWNEEHPTDPVA